jgi:CDP-glycerol glycerophosphotransferase (TagB/SpsB family)
MIESRFKAAVYMAYLIFFYIIFKPFWFLKKKEIWFFIERPFGIDNAYYLYNYVKKKDKKITSVFLCKNKKSAEFKEMLEDKNVVYRFSLRHLWYFVHAGKLIFSYDTDPFYFYKEGYSLKKLLKPRTKLIFLQHGVIKSKVNPYHKKYWHFDMFVCSAEKEAQIVKKYMGYEKEIKITGLARFDNLYGAQPEREILVMMSWKKSLQGASEEEFKKHKYYIALNNIINSGSINKLLEKYDFRLNFVLHYVMQKYSHLFNSEFERVKVIGDKTDKNNNISALIKRSALLITDYSSVLFDFAYMKRHMIFYQIGKYHYEDIFDYDKEGFGKVVKTEKQMIDELERILKRINETKSFETEKKYAERADKFFKHIDNHNCERNYQAIKRI